MWNCIIFFCSSYYVFCCGIMMCDLCAERFYYSQEPPLNEYVIIEMGEN